ncbi:MAG TPA: hypothetical protein VJI33_04335 [Candidatus Paceibacterota bacterium]
MITREQFVLSISDAFELSPNLVTAELAAMDKARMAGRPSFDELLEMTQRLGYDKLFERLMRGLLKYFDNLSVKKSVEAYVSEVSKRTHMPAETVEAFILIDGQTDEERQALSETFVRNLCFAAFKKTE